MLKKRGATEPAGSVDPKKPRIAPAKTTEVEVEEESVQISTELHDRFSIYPKQLRDIVEKGYNDEVYDILDRVQAGRPLVQGITYHIQQGARWDSGEIIYKLMLKEVLPNSAMANVKALEHFISKAPTKKALYIKAAETKLANPQYSQLHSVPPNHMGWGFDKFGCLSLRLTTIEDNKLKHEFIFVHRKAVEVGKVDGDDECQVIDGPVNAKK